MDPGIYYLLEADEDITNQIGNENSLIRTNFLI